jgi:hypothetical protein
MIFAAGVPGHPLLGPRGPLGGYPPSAAATRSAAAREAVKRKVEAARRSEAHGPEHMAIVTTAVTAYLYINALRYLDPFAGVGLPRRVMRRLVVVPHRPDGKPSSAVYA